MISGELLSSFTKLGFTKYEILAYWSLLVYGPSTAREISKRTGIPYNRVYDTIALLKSRGFVNEIRGSPKVYVAFSPRVAFLRFEKELDELKERLEKEVQAAKVEDVKAGIWRTASLDEAIEMARELIGNAKNEVILVAPERIVPLIKDDIISSLEKGVTVSLYLGRELDLSEFEGVGNFFVRRFGGLSHFIGMSDGKEVIDIQNLGFKPRNPPSFKSTYPEIIFSHYTFIREVFKESSLVLEDTNKPSDVRFFAIFHAADFIKRHINEGVIYAKVLAKNLKTLEIEELEGKVVGYAVSFDAQVDNIDIETGKRLVKVGGMFAVIEDYESTQMTLSLLK